MEALHAFIAGMLVMIFLIVLVYLFMKTKYFLEAKAAWKKDVLDRLEALEGKTEASVSATAVSAAAPALKPAAEAKPAA